ncbi:beta-ketoacyl synthase chain length factor [Achromobacter aloeverae]|uniref:3-oxoacyl-ACP synthase n=1 Tax=Achromobacter aloeverae TaxID=1750518 RepID=A0A4Q1HQA4_9BURK|nr:beta-ketoacyl synthase chain length factor [Achromobacter aloeverae]RXN92733.1 3-oxoacyl-ACP synthase [Achromobacter aloeverae]
MLKFSIPHWHAWAPGIDSVEAWRQWAQAPFVPPADTPAPTPPLGFLPAMQRRRLSTLARMAVGSAWPLTQAGEALPMVYASHHGETTRGYESLQMLARDEALSPTSFSLSVHNACAGMWSILRHDTTETVALSVQGDGLESAIIEACLLLAAGHPAVLVVLAEEQAPAAYMTWIDDIPFPYALALRLTAGHDYELAWSDRADPAVDNPSAPQARGARDGESLALPNPLSLLRHLALGTVTWTHAHQRRHWRWQHLS